MASILYKYRIFCNTDNQWEYAWSTNLDTVTTCPINPEHTVNNNSITTIVATNARNLDSDESPYIIGQKFITADTTSGPINILLPFININNIQNVVILKVSGNNNVIVSAQSGELIDSSNTFTLSSNTSIEFQSNETKWITIPMFIEKKLKNYSNKN